VTPNTDSQSLAHLDFSFSPPCDGKPGKTIELRSLRVLRPGVPCTNTATWRFVMENCCPESPYGLLLFCDDCRMRKIRAEIIVCTRCGMEWRPGVTAYVSIGKLT